MGGAPHPVDVQPVDDGIAAASLEDLQLTLHSVLGALTFHTGGILVDHGWLRVLGGGREPGLNVVKANGLDARDDDEADRPPPYLLVATDVLGGQFALDGGGLLGRPMEICYFAPDSLEWEPLEAGYASFVAWTMSPSLRDFYAPYRWDGWIAEVRAVGPAEAIATYPPLWSVEGEDLSDVSRTVVPWAEAVGQLHELATELAGYDDGSPVQFALDANPSRTA